MHRLGWLAAIVTACSSVVVAVAWQGPDSSPRPTPPPIEESERDAAYRASLDGYWQSVAEVVADARRPEVEVIAEHDDDSWEATVGECYREAGFEVVITDAGASRNIETRSDGESDMFIAKYVCDASYPYVGTIDSLLGRQQLAALWDYNVYFLAPCLTLHDAPGPAPAPTRSEYVSGYNAGHWSPYSFEAYGSVDADDYARWEKTCPYEPSWLRESATASFSFFG